MGKRERLFLDILPDNCSVEDIPGVLSKKRITLLKSHNVKTAFFVTSEPVDPEFYRSLLGTLKKAGIQTRGYYFEPGGEDILEVLRAATNDLMTSLKKGGSLVVSYRSRFALPLIASLHIAGGSGIDDAINAVRRIKNDAGPLHEFTSLLRRFKSSLGIPLDTTDAVRNAIRLSRPAASSSHDILRSHDDSRTPQATSTVIDAGTEGKKSKKRKSPSRIPGDASIAAVTPMVGSGPFYRSIRFKLISIISFIIIASLAGMILLASYFFKNDNRVRVQENNFQIAEVIALKIESEIERYRLISTLMIQDKGGVDATEGHESLVSAGESEILFTGIVTRRPGGGGFTFTNTYMNKSLMGRYRVTRANIDSANSSLESSFPISFGGEYQLYNPSPQLEHEAFALIFPYGKSSDGTVKSIIVSFISAANLLKTFNMAGITRSFMTNFKGDVIIHPDVKLINAGSNFASMPICAMMMKSKLDNGQTRYRDKEGVYHLGSFKKIDRGGFGVITSAREDEAYRAVYKIQERNLIITAMVVIVAILIIFFFGKTITSPIIRLVGATKNIIAGQYNVDIRPTSKDEIGQLTSTFVEMGKGLEEREKIKNAFGKFVNKDLAEAALRDELRLGGERKTVAILFSDIRAFTAISERLEPEEVVEFLNLYMTSMVECIEKTSGIVDKFIGDAIMAVWGTPLSRGNDTENALNAALLMRKELLQFNRDRGGTKKPIIRIGCGINTGIVLAGQIGSENRMEYTIIGDAVNLASRIESLSKAFGADILVSEDSFRLVKDIFAFEKMKQIKVKGKIEPQQIFALLGRLDDEARPRTLKELQSIIGITDLPEYSDEALARIITHGEDKYEIIEK